MSELPLEYRLNPVIQRKEKLVKDIVAFISSHGNKGVSRSNLLHNAKGEYAEEEILRVLQKLLERGVIYESEGGRYRAAHQ